MFRAKRSCRVKKELKRTALNEDQCGICLTPKPEMRARGKIPPCDHLFCFEVNVFVGCGVVQLLRFLFVGTQGCTACASC
eukprot:m.59024 g.59024  ORF g.59024 m.59024 type:complete len:80 (+) comp17281_c1_seq2:113-352(+)